MQPLGQDFSFQQPLCHDVVKNAPLGKFRAIAFAASGAE